MGDSLYSKKDISKILTKASEIQTQKELYGDKEGLTEEELIQVAAEVGIDKDSLLEALSKHDEPELKQTFNWLGGTSRIQSITNVDSEITDEIWDEVVQEIRRINGGIGKLIRTKKSYEWEQRMREIGYKHISFTPKDGKTKIQYVSSWAPLRFLSLFMSTFLFGVLSLIFFKGIGFPKETAVFFSPIGGIIGFSAGLLFLKAKYEKEKSRLSSIISAISKKIKGDKQSQITIEPQEIYSEHSDSIQSSSKTKS